MRMILDTDEYDYYVFVGRKMGGRVAQGHAKGRSDLVLYAAAIASDVALKHANTGEVADNCIDYRYMQRLHSHTGLTATFQDPSNRG